MKVGDTIICIENFASTLIIGEKYKILDMDPDNEWIDIYNNNRKKSYSMIRFISLEQYRENQLNKIL